MSDFSFALCSEAVSIVNEALSQLGSELVTSGATIDGGATPASANDRDIVIYQHFHPSVKEVLSSYGWGCVSKIASVTLETNTSDPYLLQLAKPSDFLRFNYFMNWGRKFTPSGNWQTFLFTGNNVQFAFPFTASGPAITTMSYVYYPALTGYANDAAVTAAWNAYFQSIQTDLRKAIVFMLASNMSYPLKRDEKRQLSLMNLAEAKKLDAMLVNSSQEDSEPVPDNYITEIRRHGISY